MERLILARHGESDYSVAGRCNGDPAVAVPLTELGREQARRLGEELRAEQVDLCVVTEFARTRETAELALAGRDIPFVVVAELGEIGVGSFEGRSFDDYRAWAHASGPDAFPEGGGESRVGAARRYIEGFRVLAARPERTILAVLHGLPVRYVLDALETHAPAPVLDQVAYAAPYRLGAPELERALAVIDAWCTSPSW